MIVSGSLTPGINPDEFDMPAGTALRYERPAEPLVTSFPSYAVLDSDPEIWKGPDSWALPGWAQIWIVLTAGRINVKVRSRQPEPLGQSVLYGATSRAMPVTSQGGVTVVVDVSPVGWARWFDIPADHSRDQLTPLGALWSDEWLHTLMAQLHASDRGADVKPLLDQFFLDRLPPAHRQEALIADATTLLADAELTDSRIVAKQLGVTEQAMLRLCRRHFGYGPKLIQRRTRFIRALAQMLMSDDALDFADVPTGYHDIPHFSRDAKDFLDLTARKFILLPMPYLRAVLRARTLVIGAPLPLLDDSKRPEQAERSSGPFSQSDCPGGNECFEPGKTFPPSSRLRLQS